MQRALQIISQIIRLLRPAPGVFLFFIAPILGELLSGSTPPNSFFNPLTLLFLCSLYGGGAIIARELTLYWGKGWPTLLTFGATFGVIEEGLMVKSFFDPHWKDLGLLSTYGRVFGVNWVWSVQLITFHAVFSIAIPILIVSLLFPKRRAERWAGPRTLLLLIVMFVLALVLGFLFFFPYHAPLIPYIVTLAIVVALIVVARYLPRTINVTKSTDVMQPLRFGLVGFLATVTLFLINWILPTTLTPFWVTILLTLLLDVAVIVIILHMSSNALGWTERHQSALVCGGLAFFVLLAPVIEIMHWQRTPSSSGLTFVALLIAGLLYLLNRRIRKREQKQQLQQQRVVMNP